MQTKGRNKNFASAVRVAAGAKVIEVRSRPRLACLSQKTHAQTIKGTVSFGGFGRNASSFSFQLRDMSLRLHLNEITVNSVFRSICSGLFGSQGRLFPRGWPPDPL